MRRTALVGFAAIASLLLAGCHSTRPRKDDSDAGAGASTPSSMDTEGAGSTTKSWLGRQYELDPETKGDVWRLVPHRPMYVAWHYTTDPNQASAPDPTQDVRANELEFQFSFKTKAWQGLFHDRVDLWLGYTQKGLNQILEDSVPFRTVDYAPEAFLTGRVDQDVGPLQWRTVSFGFNHESNGEPDAMSRTWNRIFAEFGLESGGFDLLVRPWWRVDEPDTIDDNPDISKYMGTADFTLRFERDGFIASLMLRNNFNFAEMRGAYELSLWAPSGLSDRLKIFGKAFYGYGETLIDYDHRQATFSIGLAFTDWN